MKTFACSDHHFYHRNIIKYAKRPFDFTDENCVIDNAKLMIHNHNKIVNKDDYVLFVGDLSASLRGRTEHFQSLIKLLNGKKILIRGNHDHLPSSFYKEAGFLDVVDYLEIDDIFICHYPCFENKNQKNKLKEKKSQKEKQMFSILEKGSFSKIIHGHIHNKQPLETDGYKRLNVCVDYEPNNFFPVELHDEKIRDFLITNY